MPLRAASLTTGGDTYATPFIGPIEHTATVRLDVSALDDESVDENGYLKPGVPLLSTGVRVSGTGQVIFGVTIESLKIAASNAAADLTAATDIDVAVATIAQVNQDIIEDILGVALTANELAAFAAAGCLVKLI
jgi:hypothetical protein